MPQALKKFQNKWKENKFVCIGLDSEYKKLPKHIISGAKSVSSAIYSFNKEIIDQTNDLACVFKPNPAFYESEFIDGIKALEKTCEYLRSKDKNTITIIDAKRGDIGNTNRGYARYIYDQLGADATTLHPYQGGTMLEEGERSFEALAPFFEDKNKLAFILCRTSNPSAGELQDLPISLKDLPLSYKKRFGSLKEIKNILGKEVVPLYIVVAYLVAKNWNFNNNLGLVVGCTYPEELSQIRRVAPNIPILIPGAGSQGGDLAKSVKNGLNSDKNGIVVNSSRGIIFASKGKDFAKAARAETKILNDQIVEAISTL